MQQMWCIDGSTSYLQELWKLQQKRDYLDNCRIIVKAVGRAQIKQRRGEECLHSDASFLFYRQVVGVLKIGINFESLGNSYS